MRKALAVVMGPRLRELGFQGSAGAGFRLDCGMVPGRGEAQSQKVYRRLACLRPGQASEGRRAQVASWHRALCWETGSSSKRRKARSCSRRSQRWQPMPSRRSAGPSGVGPPRQTGARTKALGALKRVAKTETRPPVARRTAEGAFTFTELYALDRSKQTLPIYRAALQRPVPAKPFVDERAAYTEIVNDASVLASREGNWKLALEVIDGHLHLSKELTRLTHTAACALAKANPHGARCRPRLDSPHRGRSRRCSRSGARSSERGR